ncbi:MAPEG family protein [Alteromonas pelagimontana]|uniref:MAPEG family protein n=1 Tax=Alteromonas pelagimontana TaxID=1858656 RepID=A0A6M4MFX6_9ALTE|nr:MAPEG family protein [Alteromonas pelagimontana]QJR81560.1 MAPEG family protein [Alteromonas pelagimontana]
MFLTYNLSIWGLWLILLTVFAQGFVAALAHRKQANPVPGKMDESLGHESFIFRSYRTQQNSLENLAVFVIPALLAMFIGVAPDTLAIVVWVYAIARLFHMALYYAIATNKNPSARSYFYLIGWLANLALFVIVALQLL